MTEFKTLADIEHFMAGLRAAYEDLIGGVSQTARQRIRDAVAAYSSDLLPVIEQRLQRCDSLLRQGLRDEAIGYASEEPELAAAADHMNLERFGQSYRDWMEASRRAGIVLPVPPRMEFVRNLREAEQATSTLGPLLTKWRRLNIARESLRRRLQILRQLRAADGTSPVWPDLLKTHEQHRVLQIKTVIGRLRESRFPDGAAFAAAEQELTECIEDLRGEWSTIAPPPELEESAVGALARIQTDRIDKTLDRLAVELESAHAAVQADRSAANKAQLMQVWQQWTVSLVERGAVAADDPRIARVSAAVDFAEALDIHIKSLAEANQAIRERPPTFRARVQWMESLERLVDEIEDSASRLPAADVDGRWIAELKDSVANAVDDVRREVRFRRMRILASVAAGLVLIGGVAYSAVTLARHDRLVAAAVAEIDGLREKLASGEPAALPDFTTHYPASLKHDPRLAAAIAAVSTEHETQESRRQRLATEFAAAEKLVAETRAAERPEPLAAWPSSFAEASRAIDALRSATLAVTDSEKAGIERLEKSLAAVARGFADSAEDALLIRVRKLEAELGGDVVSLRDNLDRVDALIASGDEDLVLLRRLCDMPASPGAAPPFADARLVSPAAKAQVEPDAKVAKQLNDLRAKRQVLAGLGARESRADAFLAEAAYGAYADILREIASSLGSDPLARDYQRAADDLVLWQSVSEWNTFVDNLPALETVSGEGAAALLGQMEAWKPEVRGLSSARAVVGWLPKYLQEVRDLTSDRVADFRGAVEKIVRSKYGMQLDAMIVSTEETTAVKARRYYCLRRGRPIGEESGEFTYVTGWPDATGEWPTRTLRKYNVEQYSLQDSPQKKLAEAGLEQLAKFSTVETQGIRAVSLAVAVLQACSGAEKPAVKSRAEADPLLQAILLRYIVLESVKVHPLIRKELERAIRMLEAGQASDGQEIQVQGVDNQSFEEALQPDKQHANLVIEDGRQQCAIFIREVREGSIRAAKSLEAELARVKDADLPRYDLVGRLRKQRDGGWSISGGNPARRNAQQVFVLHRVGADIKLDAVAVCNERGEIPPGTKVTARAGDPVYVKASKRKHEAKSR